MALAAIQGLNQKEEEWDAEIRELKAKNEALENLLENLEKAIKVGQQKAHQ